MTSRDFARLTALLLAPLLLLGALIEQIEVNAFVQECEFSQACSQRFELILRNREDSLVGQECDSGTCLIALTYNLNIFQRSAS